MKLHSVVRNASLILALACMALAYFPLAGYWVVALAAAAALPAWIVPGKKAAFWPASGWLSVYFMLALMGILLKRSLLLVIPGSISALVWWDLVDLAQGLDSATLSQAATLLRSYRLRSLSIAIAVSLLLEVAAYLLHLQLAFGVIVILVLLASGGILYATRLLLSSGNPRHRN